MFYFKGNISTGWLCFQFCKVKVTHFTFPFPRNRDGICKIVFMKKNSHWLNSLKSEKQLHSTDIRYLEI